MLERINPTTTQAWFVLKKHYEDEMSRKHMRDLFAADEKRFETYSIATSDILFDYSKNIITDKTKQLLLQLAKECNLKEAIDFLALLTSGFCPAMAVTALRADSFLASSLNDPVPTLMTVLTIFGTAKTFL